MRFINLACTLALATTACGWDDDRPIVWERERTVLGPIPLKTQVAYVDSALDRVTLLDLADDHAADLDRGDRPQRDPGGAEPRSPPAVRDHARRGGDPRTARSIRRRCSGSSTPRARRPSRSRTRSARRSIGSRSSPDNTHRGRVLLGRRARRGGLLPQPERARGDRPHPAARRRQPDAQDHPLVRLGARGHRAVAADGRARRRHRGAAHVRVHPVVEQPDRARRHPPRAPRDHDPPRSRRPGRGPARDRVRAATPRARTCAATTRATCSRSCSSGIEPTTEGGNDYRPQLAELGAGGGPTDIAVYDDATGRRYILAATPNTGEIVVIDADTAQFRSVPLADPIDRILLFPTGGDAPPTRRCSPRSAPSCTRVHVLDLEHINDPLTQASIRTIALDQAGARCRAGARARPRDARPRRRAHRARPARHGHRVDLAAARRRQARLVRLLARRLAPDRRDAQRRRGSASSRSTTCTRPTSGSTIRRARVLVDRRTPRSSSITATRSATRRSSRRPTAGRDDAIVLAGFLTFNLLDQEP